MYPRLAISCVPAIGQSPEPLHLALVFASSGLSTDILPKTSDGLLTSDPRLCLQLQLAEAAGARPSRQWTRSRAGMSGMPISSLSRYVGMACEQL